MTCFHTCLYGISQVLLAFVRITLHLVLSIFYKGKGNVVPPVKNPLLLQSASKVARDIREGKCKSEEIMQAYIDRIREVEPYINATVECRFEESLKESREVDEIIASGRFTNVELCLEKPLFGVPISIKCIFHVKDMLCTAGCLFHSDLRAKGDAPVVAALKKAGAIVITTTNLPELGLDIETANKLHGRTSNPYDTNRICGGSSGGEASLISAAASILGLGNDLLGSLRIPAHFTGIFSHMPSRGLVSNQGSIPFEKPDFPIQPSDVENFKYLSCGPMCRYAEDLMTSMKVLSLDNEVRLKFDQEVDFKKVKIFYLKEIQSPLVVPVDQDIATALKNAVSYFEKQYNITPKEIQLPDLFDINRCIVTVMESLFLLLKASTMGHKGFELNGKLEFVKSLFGKSKLCLSTTFKLGCISNPLLFRKSQISHYQKTIKKWRDGLNKYLDENAVLLMPTFPVSAPYHSETLPLLLSVCYTSLFSVLGLPVTQCPLGFSKQGLPIGIQIVGIQNNDPLTIPSLWSWRRLLADGNQ